MNKILLSIFLVLLNSFLSTQDRIINCQKTYLRCIKDCPIGDVACHRKCLKGVQDCYAGKKPEKPEKPTNNSFINKTSSIGQCNKDHLLCRKKCGNESSTCLQLCQIDTELCYNKVNKESKESRQNILCKRNYVVCIGHCNKSVSCFNDCQTSVTECYKNVTGGEHNNKNSTHINKGDNSHGNKTEENENHHNKNGTDVETELKTIKQCKKLRRQCRSQCGNDSKTCLDICQINLELCYNKVNNGGNEARWNILCKRDYIVCNGRCNGSVTCFAKCQKSVTVCYNRNNNNTNSTNTDEGSNNNNNTNTNNNNNNNNNTDTNNKNNNNNNTDTNNKNNNNTDTNNNNNNNKSDNKNSTSNTNSGKINGIELIRQFVDCQFSFQDCSSECHYNESCQPPCQLKLLDCYTKCSVKTDKVYDSPRPSIIECFGNHFRCNKKCSKTDGHCLANCFEHIAECPL